VLDAIAALLFGFYVKQIWTSRQLCVPSTVLQRAVGTMVNNSDDHCLALRPPDRDITIFNGDGYKENHTVLLFS
jgi:hypothetical protein